MEFEILLQLVEKFGIISVLGWFMFRMEKIIIDNTKALENLKYEIAKRK